MKSFKQWTFNILDVPEIIATKVAHTVVVEAQMGIKARWIDKVLRQIGAKRYHLSLLQEARLLRLQLEELQQEIKEVRGRFAKLDT